MVDSVSDTSVLTRPSTGPYSDAPPPAPSPAPAPPPTPSASPVPRTSTSGSPLLTGISDLLAGNQAAMETVRRASDQGTGLDAQATKLATDLDALKTKIGTPPSQERSSPIDAFGSAAMALAAMGSMMTRRPMTNALSAGADALEAYRRGETETMQRAMQKWRAETDAAMTIHRFEQDAYKTAMERRDSDLKGAQAMMATTAAALKDQVVQNLLAAGRTEDAVNMIVGRRILGERMGGASAAAQDAAKRQEFLNRFRAAGTPEEKAAIDQEFQDYVRFTDPTVGRSGALADAKDPLRQKRMDAYAELEAARKAGDEEGTKAALQTLNDLRAATPGGRTGKSPEELALKEREIENKRIAEENKLAFAREKLDASRLTADQKLAIEQGRLDLARLSQSALQAFREGKLDLARLSQSDLAEFRRAGLAQREAQFDATMDQKRVAEDNKTRLIELGLDIKRFSAEHQADIQSGKLALARMNADDLAAYRSGKLDLNTWATQNRIRQGDERIANAQVAETNRQRIATEKLDLARLSEDNRNAIQQGRLDLSRMTADDLNAIRQGRLDLDTWAAQQRARQGDARIEQGNQALDLKAIAQANSAIIQRGRLDLARLTQEQRNDIAQGRLDLSIMSQRERGELAQGRLDLDRWKAENMGGGSMGGQRARLVQEYMDGGMSREAAIEKAAAAGRQQTASQYAITQIEQMDRERAARGEAPMTPEEKGRMTAVLSGKGRLNDRDLLKLEDRAQMYTFALDAVNRLQTIAARTPLVSGGMNRVLGPTETVANLLHFSSDTDRHDFVSALDYLKLNAPLLLKHANPTSRAIGNDQALVNNIIRGGNWGDTFYNFQSALANNKAIWQNDLKLLQQQYRGGTGTPMNLPNLPAPGVQRPAQGYAPPPSGAPAIPAGPAPWLSDPVRK